MSTTTETPEIESPEVKSPEKKIYDFRTEFTLEERKAEGERITKKYPNRLPVIVQKGKGDTKLPDFDKHKFLVPRSITMGMFFNIIRKRIKLKPEEAMFMFVNDQLVCNSETMEETYEKHKNPVDLFLLVEITGESVFG